MNGSVFTFPGIVTARGIDNVDLYDSPREPYQRPVPDSDGDIFIANSSLELSATLPAELV